MNLAAVYRFCCTLEEKYGKNCADVVVISANDKKDITNAAFLLGAHMIMHRGFDPAQVAQSFQCIRPRLASYRDVSPGKQNFHLRLVDCWEGLWRAKQLSWVSFAPGGFDVSDYEQLDCPLNADLHDVVPGKFVAMRGPVALPAGRTYEDTAGGSRSFSPAHYADILRQYDVQVVVRLNEARYDAAEWEAEGLALADLPFDDCTPPPPVVVAKFLAIAEGVPGALAVHCKAGLGRTGTLIALYMMKHHGFTARQAMGWLRIVRPGSVIGPQQQYLCDSETAIRAAGEGYRRRGGAARVADGADVPALRRFIAAAVAASEASAAALLPPLGRAASMTELEVQPCKLLAEQVSSAAAQRDVQRSLWTGVGCLPSCPAGPDQ